MLMPLMSTIAQMTKYTILLRRMKEFSKLLDEIKKDWSTATQENRQIFSAKASIEHKLTTVIAITIYGGGIFYRMILPLSKGRIVLPNNVTIRLLPCPGYFGSLNVQITPNYEIIFTLQILGGFVIYTALCGVKSSCLMLCMHMCGLLRILTNKVMELTSDKDEKVVQEKIVYIVQYQTRIKEWVPLFFFFWRKAESMKMLSELEKIAIWSKRWFQILQLRWSIRTICLFYRNDCRSINYVCTWLLHNRGTKDSIYYIERKIRFIISNERFDSLYRTKDSIHYIESDGNVLSFRNGKTVMPWL